MSKIHLTIGENCDKRLDYLSSVGISELFPDSFMEEFTDHKTFTNFCEFIGCDLTQQTDLKGLQESNAFDSAIRSCSKFESWQNMVQTAYQRLLNEN